ncbi:MAG: glutamate synthase subunit beta [Bacteroidetes bacterium]|nr:MAG: glutamate synthase subunit beta [Bacteroidota bacterium]
MSKPTGFLEYNRELPRSRDPKERIGDFKEFYEKMPEEKYRQQAQRCMDCGVPFCHHGCPLGNNIPEFNDAVGSGNWIYAYQILDATNNFPEFTGRICPAPCEGSCVLGINKPPVAIELIEKTITEKAFEAGLIKAKPPLFRTGKKVAVVGSGPAGLAAAAQLNTAGHWVTVFERDTHPGGLLRYGVPDFKLEKWVVERRVQLLEQEGISFRCGVEVGKDITTEELRSQFDALILCTGALTPRDFPAPGRELKGVHFAMDYLTQQNKALGGEAPAEEPIHAKDKHVLVIGGGDTGSDCIGTANRQGAASVTQITWGEKPPSERGAHNPWPEWPMVLQTSSSHEEGCDRHWSVLIKAFVGDESGLLRALRVVDIHWHEGRRGYDEVPGSERELPCDLALLAMGFLHTEHEGPVGHLGLALDHRGNVKTTKYHSSVEGVFAAGDARRGASLVVWAISEGRECARTADTWLMGSSRLPAKEESLTNVASWV